MTQNWQEVIAYYAKQLISDAEFQALFAPQQLLTYRPLLGSDSVEPILQLITMSPRRQVVLHPYGFDTRRFNDWEYRRRRCLQVAEQAARAGLEVVAMLMASETWMREFTPEEAALRGSRMVESYPDKTECVAVFGRTIDGRTGMARAPLFRGAERNLVVGVGEWEVWVLGARGGEPVGPGGARPGIPCLYPCDGPEGEGPAGCGVSGHRAATRAWRCWG